MIRIAAFDNVVKGVTGFCDNVKTGHSPARTIRANASAPPNKPIRQTISATGTIIMAYPILKKYDSFQNMTEIITAMIPKISQ